MKMESQLIAYLLNGSEHIYWIFEHWSWSALNMGYMDKWPSKLQRKFYYFWKQVERAVIFGRDLIILFIIIFFRWGLPKVPYPPPLESL